jgi:hypothetical protein
MSNSKKSNQHSLRKYLIILSLFGCLPWALSVQAVNKNMVMKNQKISVVKNTTLKSLKSDHANLPYETEGRWFAVIKNERVYIEFKSIGHNTSSNLSFSMDEFSALPKTQKGDFTLIRDAGTITFNGKFDGDQGFGQYKFSSNKEFKANLTKVCIDQVEEADLLTFLMLEVKGSYLKALLENSFTGTKRQITSLVAFNVSPYEMKFWRKAGFINLTSEQLVSSKLSKIDSNYVRGIQKAGYSAITFQQLMTFKAFNITAQYINMLKKGRSRLPNRDPLTVEEIINEKVTNNNSATARVQHE